MEHLETWRITLREIVAVCLIKIFEQKLEFYRKLKSSIFGMKIQITLKDPGFFTTPNSPKVPQLVKIPQKYHYRLKFLKSLNVGLNSQKVQM